VTEAQRIKLLRVVFYADAFVLMLIGVMLMFATRLMFDIFKMPQMSAETSYITGMWGALMSTMGVGYFLAARIPQQSTNWVIVGIFRAMLEVAVSVFCVVTCVVQSQTAWFGIALAAWFAIAYLVLYPYGAKALRCADAKEVANG